MILSTTTCSRREYSDAIQQLRDDYLQSLVGPMDGMWESAVIAHAAFWELQARDQHAGYFCIGSDNTLLRFHLEDDFKSRAEEIFRWVVSTHGIRHAITSTIEPLYFSLCLDLQRSIVLHSYLFLDQIPAQMPAALGNRDFRNADRSEEEDIARFYRAHTDGAGEWIEAFVHDRLQREELYGFYDRQTLVATGECIPSGQQPPYADLGVVVAREQRGKGIATSMLLHLKRRCYEVGWTPICSCAADNRPSKRAIEKAGFISEQRMVEVTFAIDTAP